MALLRILTLGYVAVLIVALAASLIAIWLMLRRIARSLAAAADPLERVRDVTVPLEPAIEPLETAFEESASDAAAAAEALSAADRNLETLATLAGGVELPS